MLALAYLMVLLGIAALLWHVLFIRPSQPLSRWLQVNGLAIVFLLFYLRVLVILIRTGGADYTGHIDGDLIFRVVSGYVIDALIIERVRSFTRYRRAYLAREAELQAQDPTPRQADPLPATAIVDPPRESGKN